MSMRSVVLVFGLVCSSLSWGADPWSTSRPKGASACPAPREMSAELVRLTFASDPILHEKAHAVIGVTHLGRLVIALDTNHDQYVDEYIQLSDDTRLQGPWSRQVERATVLLTKGTVRFEAPDQSIGVAAGVEGSELPSLSKDPTQFSTYIHMPAAFELLRLNAPQDASKKVLLADIDVANFDALPERLKQDSIGATPQTGPTPCNCDEDACTHGGCGASACSLPPCSVTCAQPPGNPQTYFACCKYNQLQPNTCKCVRYNASCFQ